MCQFETPLFIYYSYIAVIAIASISAFSILLKNPKQSLNRNAFLFLSVLALWTAGDLVQWVTRDAQTSYLFLRLSYLIDFFFLFFLYFAYDLAGEKLSGKKKLMFAWPAFLTAVLVAGNFGVGSVEPKYCNYDSGWLIFYSLPIDLFYCAWATAVMIKKYRHSPVYYKTKLQIGVLVFAIMSFVLWNVAYESVDIFRMPGKLDIEISPYFILGNLFFLALVAFAIIEYDLFNFGILPRKWFTFAILSVVFGGMLLLTLTPMFYLFLGVFYAAIIWLFWGK